MQAHTSHLPRIVVNVSRYFDACCPRLRRGEITRRCVAFSEKKKKKHTCLSLFYLPPPSFFFFQPWYTTVYGMETILSSDKQESVRNMLSTREHISRSKTNDVSPFRKYIGRERYERLMRVCVCARERRREIRGRRGARGSHGDWHRRLSSR